MRTNPLRWAVLFASLLLVSVYFFPLWQIELWAPQYPEGLSMSIWINQITGDVRNINILNHYIGMHKILPDEFLEFKVFGPIAGTLIASGLLAGGIGRKWLTVSWTVIFLVLMGIAAFDFYNWEYKFGHDLSPDAPIKVEGMAYQPPFLGVRSLLNISAWSLPGLAGYAVLLGMLLVILAGVLEFRLARKRKRVAVGVAAALLGVLGCTPQVTPQPIDLGHDPCTVCKMTISDQRFGGEAISPKGKSYKFDSLECMQEFKSGHETEGFKYFVVDSEHSGRFISVDQAYYVESDQLHAPMGRPILAFSTEEGASHLKLKAGRPSVMRWSQLLKVVTSTSASQP